MAHKKLDTRILALAAFIVIVIGGGIAALAYLAVSQQYVYIDKSLIQAPVVDLKPTHAGILKDVYVDAGQTVAPNTVVAAVDTELIKATAGGLVISAADEVGKQVTPQDTVVELIDPAQLRVVGQLDEDKGLKDIKVGDRAKFTVDAFPGQEFTGVVDEIAPTSHAGDVVFNISDKRETQTFDVKITFDHAGDPGFKNGMSAKIWVYKR